VERNGLAALPAEFDWGLVGGNFARSLRAYIKQTPELREQLTVALLERQAEAVERMAGPDPGFDVAGLREFLRKKCGMLPLSAMHTSADDRRVSLWNVFVAQTARQSVPVRELPRELLRQMRQEKQVGGQQVEAEQVARLREIYQTSPSGPVLEALARERLAVVLGDPGSGKTSLLKYLAMRWVEAAGAAQEPLPIWIDLKEYVQERKGILTFVESGCASFHLDARALEQRLKQGQAVIYLDGLDEIFDGPTRGSVMEEIAALAASYPGGRMVLTSRIIGYEADRLANAGFAHLTLEEFDDRQIEEFLLKWHDTAEEDAKERVRLTQRMRDALRESRAVRELAGNPLLLTMTAILNRTQPLPRNRVELYEQASRVLLHEWDASRSLPVDTFARQEKEALLRELAGAMQKGEGGLAGNLIERDLLIAVFRNFLNDLGMVDAHAKAVALVGQLTERNFILCYAGVNRFSFVHRTFLEYFCAAWFVERFEKKQTMTLEEIKTEVYERHWKDVEWHEVLRLICGMVGAAKAEELILFLAGQDGKDEKLGNLALAAECLGEVRNRKAVRGTDEELREKVILRGVRYGAPHYYTQFEEYKYAGPTREKFVGLLAGVWRDGWTREWLQSSAAGDSDRIVRRAALRELARGWKDDPEALPMLKERARADENNWVRRAAVQELARGWKDDPETLPMLKECVRADADWSVRTTAMRELARGWKGDPETLHIVKECAHADADEYLRAVSTEELARGWKDDPEVRAFLVAESQRRGEALLAASQKVGGSE